MRALNVDQAARDMGGAVDKVARVAGSDRAGVTCWAELPRVRRVGPARSPGVRRLCMAATALRDASSPDPAGSAPNRGPLASGAGHSGTERRQNGAVPVPVRRAGTRSAAERASGDAP